MDIYEDAIVPETPKAIPNEQMFIYVPIAGPVYPGIASFDSTDFEVKPDGRVYMKVSPVRLARSIDAHDERLRDLEKISDEVGFAAVTISASDWSDELPTHANITFPAPGVVSTNKSYMALFIPADNETRAVSTAADIYIDNTILSEDLNMNISVICKESVPSIDLNYVAIIFVEESRTKSSAGAAAFVSIGAGGSSRTETYIGATPPEKDRYNLWVDTSSEFPVMKYKDASGEWGAVAGGVGTGGFNTIKVINTSGWISKKIGHGSDPNIKINWSSEEPGNGSVRVKINGVDKISKTVPQGEIVVDGVGKYLVRGINRVEVTVSDALGSSRTITYTVDSISVSISSYFDDSRPYTGEITFAYIPVGAVSKTVYFLVDGHEIGTQIVTESGNEQSYDIPAQSHGSHTLEVYFMADIDGESVPSNHLYYDLICTEEGNNTPIITTSFRQASAKQYGTAVIPYIVYRPNSLTSAVQLKDGDKVKELTVDRTRQTWSYKAVEAGTKNLEIVCGETVKHISFEVVKSDISVQAESKNLQLYLTSQGRANTEANPLDWSYGNVKAEMTGFNLKSDCWQSDADGNAVLRVAGDARVNIPFNVFGTDFRDAGKTIEIEFATRDVMNYDAIVLSSWSGERGIQITAQKAELRSQNSHIFTQYKEDEHVRITFSVEKKSENRLLSIYINGIMSGVVQYGENDDFSQADPVGISIGSNDCTVDIYCIRVYGNKLNRSQILKNWMADTQDVDIMTDRYVRNDIFDDYGNIAISKLPSYLPYLVVNAESYEWLPKKKGDVKIVSGRYEDPDNPDRSFTFETAEIDVQGTSSETYPRKNYKMKFKGGFVVKGNTQEAYQFRPTSMPTDVFTFKADVASSEGANNVELVRFYEDTCPVKTPPQAEDPRVRQGIEGYPCLMFYYDGQNYNFLGKYNFNNDKATEEVFGFEEGDESWEIRLNNTDMVIWKDDNFEGDVWKASFEARFPDKNDDIKCLQALSSWLKSTDTTAVDTEEEKAARLAKFKSEFTNWFNKDALIFNYIFTELFLLMDNRAKNAFPTRYDEDGKWLILPYDYDSAIGINNMGELKYGYHLEDIDYVGDAPVFNGQDSVLFVNIRLAFADEIKEMYQDLRKTDLFSYAEIERRFEEHQCVWGEAIFNEDARFKYIEPLTQNNDGDYLYMLQGSKAEQRKWWLYNRFRYMDSKYSAGDSTLDFIKIRTKAVADITVTPYADIYASAKFDSIVVTERALRGKDENGDDLTYTLVNPLSAGKETDLLIYSASQLASVGDLSGLKAATVDFSKAIRLSSLKIGSDATGYDNPNLTSLTVGNLTLLKSIDLRGCSALAQTVDLSGCANIEHVYCEGTKITGVNLPNGGILKTLHLPATVNSLIVRNQPYLNSLIVPSYDNLTTLSLENPNAMFNMPRIVEQLKGKPRVRLIGIDCSFADSFKALEFYAKLDTFRGLDENGGNVDKAVVSGKIHIGKATEDTLAEIEGKYLDVHVTYETLANTVVFIVNGKAISTQFLDAGETIVKPDDPANEVTPAGIRTFKGWSLDGETVIEIPDTMGDESLTFTAVFEEEYFKYMIRFLNSDGSLLTQGYFTYGTTPVYAGTGTPVNPYDSDLKFLGWEPAITVVTGDADYVAQYDTPAQTRALLMRTIGEYSNDSIKSIDSYAFYDCTKLTNVSLPAVTTIGSYAFVNCSNLTSIDIQSVTSLANSSLFSSCPDLVSVRLPGTPPTISASTANYVNSDCVFYIPTGSLSAYQSDSYWSSVVSKCSFVEEDRV